jgi:glycosyltransferase involved in cell wall biosynthesis
LGEVLKSIGVVIPCYKASRTILDVLSKIGPEVSRIFVVDDACPESSGELVKKTNNDPRISIIFHQENQGVGGAVISGYKAALEADLEVIVKLDADGQMNPNQILDLIDPITSGKADYTKGNRFANLAGLEEMPGIRVLGNGALSLLSKFSSGYWNITDPTNGFTAIHRDVLKLIPLEMLSKRFFFESDMLFRLSIVRAVVWDVAMDARYGEEKSNLSVAKALLEFPIRHFSRFHKRLFYNYYLRDMSAASLELPLGAALGWFGLIFGLVKFRESLITLVPATAGTVMFSAVPLILGFQLVLAFLNYDIASVPKRVKHKH